MRQGDVKSKVKGGTFFETGGKRSGRGGHCPWGWGWPHAQAMKRLGLCLEEYVLYVKAGGEG